MQKTIKIHRQCSHFGERLHVSFFECLIVYLQLILFDMTISEKAKSIRPLKPVMISNSLNFKSMQTANNILSILLLFLVSLFSKFLFENTKHVRENIWKVRNITSFKLAALNHDVYDVFSSDLIFIHLSYRTKTKYSFLLVILELMMHRSHTESESLIDWLKNECTNLLF